MISKNCTDCKKALESPVEISDEVKCVAILCEDCSHKFHGTRRHSAVMELDANEVLSVKRNIIRFLEREKISIMYGLTAMEDILLDHRKNGYGYSEITEVDDQEIN